MFFFHGSLNRYSVKFEWNSIREGMNGMILMIVLCTLLGNNKEYRREQMDGWMAFKCCHLLRFPRLSSRSCRNPRCCWHYGQLGDAPFAGNLAVLSLLLAALSLSLLLFALSCSVRMILLWRLRVYVLPDGQLVLPSVCCSLVLILRFFCRCLYFLGILLEVPELPCRCFLLLLL